MVSKVNFKAKIHRHSRIFRDNISKVNYVKKIYNRFWLNSIFFVVVFLLPIYPFFSSYIYWESAYYYKWLIDEKSIIDSYTETDDNSYEATISSSDSFIAINNLNSNNDIFLEKKENNLNLDEKRKEIITYTIKPWDNLSSIAYKFGISNNSIIWSNNLNANHVFHPWEKIKIPPVSWLIYQIKSWDTISTIRQKYKIDSNKILTQNGISNAQNIKSWQFIVLPWASKIEQINKQIKEITKNTKTTWYDFSKKANSTYTNEGGSYELVKRKPQWRFAAWNCTWFVAQYKNVTWSWNAKNWLNNAKNKWVPTWTEASVWAIVVFNWRWYNPYYWHVWIVTGISGWNLIVKDMNYRSLYEVTTRKVPLNDRSIRWYIYVD